MAVPGARYPSKVPAKIVGTFLVGTHLMTLQPAEVRGMPNGIVLRRNEEEADLVAAARRHDEFAIRTLIQQHNHMLFRLERSVLRDDRLD